MNLNFESNEGECRVIISDEQLERLGNYYCSEFVRTVMLWVIEVPFHEWLERNNEQKLLPNGANKYDEVTHNDARF